MVTFVETFDQSAEEYFMKVYFPTVFCEIIFSESVLGRSYLGPNFFATKLRSGWRPPHLPSFRQLLCDV